ncbi:MAG: hypothetical protein V8T37_02810 [Streptococcus sp.]
MRLSEQFLIEKAIFEGDEYRDDCLKWRTYAAESIKIVFATRHFFNGD